MSLISATGLIHRVAITFDMRSIKKIVLASAIVLMLGCSTSDTDYQTVTIEGSDTQLLVRDAVSEDKKKTSRLIQDLLQNQNRQSHAWKPSELHDINAALASGRSAAISKENLHLLDISKQLYLASDAYFDPSIGSLVKMWGFYTDKFPITTSPPDSKQISDWIVRKPAFLDIKVDGKTISASNPNTQLDFATILEGSAAIEIRKIATKHQIKDALVKMGSDQFTIGNTTTRPWTVTLSDPFGGELGQVELLGNEALFSSGNFNKFHVAPTGSRWGHILNPMTGKPSQGSAAVVVLHRDPVMADAASSALMAAGPGNFGKLVKKMKLACAMMVTEENELLITSQMKKRIVFFRDPVPLGQPIANGESCA